MIENVMVTDDLVVLTKPIAHAEDVVAPTKGQKPWPAYQSLLDTIAEHGGSTQTMTVCVHTHFETYDHEEYPAAQNWVVATAKRTDRLSRFDLKAPQKGAVEAL